MAGLGVALVTGGHGLLGSWLVKRAARARHDRRAARPRGPPALGAGDGGHRRPRASRPATSATPRRSTGPSPSTGPTRSAHLAAQSIVGEANRDPAPTFDVNVRGTWTVLEACRRHGVGAAVVASSDKVYGARRPPVPRGPPTRGALPIRRTKAAADLIAGSYGHAHGLPVTPRAGQRLRRRRPQPSRLVPESVRPRSRTGGRSSAPTVAPCATSSRRGRGGGVPGAAEALAEGATACAGRRSTAAPTTRTAVLEVVRMVCRGRRPTSSPTCAARHPARGDRPPVDRLLAYPGTHRLATGARSRRRAARGRGLVRAPRRRPRAGSRVVKFPPMAGHSKWAAIKHKKGGLDGSAASSSPSSRGRSRSRPARAAETRR